MTENQSQNKLLKQKATKAYTTPRPFGGFQIPITIQSTTLRNYCEKNNLIFHLHVVENQIPDTYLVLESLVEKANQYGGIAMCSVSMLPSDHKYRHSIVRRILERGCALNFTFEQIVVTSFDQIAELEELVSLIDLASNNVVGNSQSLINLL